MTDNAKVYVAAALAAVVATMIWVDPDRGRAWKWIYWVGVPMLVVGLLSLAFDSLVAGFAFGIPAWTLMAIGYFRYRL